MRAHDVRCRETQVAFSFRAQACDCDHKTRATRLRQPQGAPTGAKAGYLMNERA
jgi:hypothetical protein